MYIFLIEYSTRYSLSDIAHSRNRIFMRKSKDYNYTKIYFFAKSRILSNKMLNFNKNKLTLQFQ